ncbi:hypothetical protein M427DRAFT_53268 [Gonapodya prolifera JEL478]|uniref:Uncharacterized protein n=1 Tax=Gonapodya prolifera (strain JEL478) TaxID=1344416 RepID=A0A139ARF7_GONPJ|nr:hypothetical protein M427DRAFT_53268 [Gonapodya prolifera JEL478]|eukprot:KXS19341.1 hypothetical protein M427DRAFT_53268 [Gonapodya prolifera JEL478]
MATYDQLPEGPSSFSLFREAPWPSYWPSHITPWQFYYEGITISAVYGFVAFLALLFLPTFDLKNPRVRGSAAIFFGALYVSYAILPLGIFGYSWCTGTVESRMPVAVGPQGLEIKARVGLHIGLLGVNITMEGLPVTQFNRTVYYVEHYPWSDPWAQGRTGFGRYGNHLARVHRERQEHGVPTPIQWVAEYFWLDGERIRWGRNYRQGAHYAFLILRTAVVAVGIILAIYITGALSIGSWLTFVLGALILSAAVTFAAYTSPIWNLNPIAIPFRDGTLRCTYGASFWNCVAAGALCMIGSVATHGRVLSWFKELYGDNFEESEPRHSIPDVATKGSSWPKSLVPSFGKGNKKGQMESYNMEQKPGNGWGNNGYMPVLDPSPANLPPPPSSDAPPPPLLPEVGGSTASSFQPPAYSPPQGAPLLDPFADPTGVRMRTSSMGHTPRTVSAPPPRMSSGGMMIPNVVLTPEEQS